MKRNKYIKPTISICRIETSQMMATSAPHRYDDPAKPDLDVLVNENDFTDIWGNKF